MGRLACASALLLALAGCAHSKIAGTEIDDTDDNRQIVAIVGEYHKAFQDRDAVALIKLVSPKYYEDNGNADPADDYDVNGLQERLAEEFAKTRVVQLEMRVDDVIVKENKAYAVIFYTMRAETEFPSGMKWKAGTDRARIGFERSLDGKKWLIVSGL